MEDIQLQAFKQFDNTATLKTSGSGGLAQIKGTKVIYLPVRVPCLPIFFLRVWAIAHSAFKSTGSKFLGAMRNASLKIFCIFKDIQQNSFAYLVHE